MPGIVDRVAVEALSVRPVRALVTVLTLPFVVLGFVLGVLWIVIRFAFAAVKVGIAEAQARVAAQPAAPVPALPTSEDEGT